MPFSLHTQTSTQALGTDPDKDVVFSELEKGDVIQFDYIASTSPREDAADDGEEEDEKNLLFMEQRKGGFTAGRWAMRYEREGYMTTRREYIDGSFFAFHQVSNLRVVGSDGVRRYVVSCNDTEASEV